MWGAAAAFIGAAATGAIGVLLVQGGHSQLALLASCFIGGAMVNGMQSYLYAVSAHSYPTEIRGAAIGVAQAFSRIGGLLSATVPQVYFKMIPGAAHRPLLLVRGCLCPGDDHQLLPDSLAYSAARVNLSQRSGR